MAVEDVRASLRSQLEENYGVDGAAYLVDRPPGGWSDLATHRDIDALEARTNAQFAEVTAGIDRRFVDVNRRFTDLETNIDRRFTDLETNIDRRFTDLETHVGQRFTDFDAKLDAKLGGFDAKLGGFDAKLDGFNASLDARFATAFTSQLRWTVGTMIGLGAIFVAALKF